jgi:hypothetical protein
MDLDWHLEGGENMGQQFNSVPLQLWFRAKNRRFWCKDAVGFDLGQNGRGTLCYRATLGANGGVFIWKQKARDGQRRRGLLDRLWV